MTVAGLMERATDVAMGIMLLAIALTVFRIIRGPTLADRVLGLDTITVLGMGLIGIVTIKSGIGLYVDIAIALGLVGFLSTVALARYVLQRRRDLPAGEEGE